MFNPSSFTTRDESLDVAYAFNRAVSADRDPNKHLRKAKKSYVNSEGKTLTINDLYGHKDNRRGCFSVIKCIDPLDNEDYLDVAIYDVRPKDLNEVAVANAIYIKVIVAPGWGYEVAAKVKEEVASALVWEAKAEAKQSS